MADYRDTVDIYLLRVLYTLLVERSVTRTAVKLNQSQPAISAALRRLRDITGDPLLARAKSGMVPTERGLALLEPVTNALHEISRIAIAKDAFDPKHSIRSFRIGSPDYLNILFVPSLVERFRAAAPHARLELHSLSFEADHEELLASGTFDLVLGNWPESSKLLRRRSLFSDEVVCLVSADHPLAKRARAGGMISEADYLSAAHLAITPYSPTHRGPIETHLTHARLKRDVRVLVPYFSLAPPLLLKTDLVFTTTRRFAEFHARHLGLAVLSAPIEFPRIEYYLLWHPRSHLAEEVQWLIERVVGAV